MPNSSTSAPATVSLLRASAGALALFAACSGQVNRDDGNSGDKPRSPTGTPTTDPGLNRIDSKKIASCAKATGPGNPGAPIARRLNRREYDNTIAELLLDTSRPGHAFPFDERLLNFDTMSSALTVSPTLTEAYLSTAKALSVRAVKDHVKDLLPCDPAANQKQCSDRFIAEFGQRAFRRPLKADEVTLLADVFAQGLKTNFNHGMELVIEVAVQSAPFLYRMELQPDGGNAGDVERVDSWQMASRLSYLLWSSMPDRELFTAAAADKLRDPGEIARQVTRMIADPRGREVVGTFHEQWLGLGDQQKLDKDKAVFPTWQDATFGLMREEMRAFSSDVIFGGGRWNDLMTAPYTMLNSTLAQHYGVDFPGGDGFVRVELPDGHGAGVLTQGGSLSVTSKTNQASPIKRGQFIREHLLCQSLPPPPPEVDTSPPSLDPGLTTRERFAQHTADDSCGNCHSLLDPLGFGLSNFDGIGRYQDKENGHPIDARGELVAVDVEGEYNGAAELAGKLAGSKEVQRCFVSNWFRFAFGRVETDDDLCALQVLDQRMTDSKSDLKDLIVALTNIDNFQYRRLEER